MCICCIVSRSRDSLELTVQCSLADPRNHCMKRSSLLQCRISELYLKIVQVLVLMKSRLRRRRIHMLRCFLMESPDLLDLLHMMIHNLHKLMKRLVVMNHIHNYCLIHILHMLRTLAS